MGLRRLARRVHGSGRHRGRTAGLRRAPHRSGSGAWPTSTAATATASSSIPTSGPGVGLVRGGVGTALVGSHEEVAERMLEYQALGFDEFILSGYPHLEEAYWFGEGVMPILRRARPPPAARGPERTHLLVPLMRVGLLVVGHVAPTSVHVAGDYPGALRRAPRATRGSTSCRSPSTKGGLPASTGDCDAWLLSPSRCSVDRRSSLDRRDRGAAPRADRHASAPTSASASATSSPPRPSGRRSGRAVDGWEVGVHDYEIVANRAPLDAPGRRDGRPRGQPRGPGRRRARRRRAHGAERRVSRRRAARRRAGLDPPAASGVRARSWRTTCSRGASSSSGPGRWRRPGRRRPVPSIAA